jgi:hypothetical protein
MPSCTPSKACLRGKSAQADDYGDMRSGGRRRRSGRKRRCEWQRGVHACAHCSRVSFITQSHCVEASARARRPGGAGGARYARAVTGSPDSAAGGCVARARPGRHSRTNTTPTTRWRVARRRPSVDSRRTAQRCRRRGGCAARRQSQRSAGQVRCSPSDLEVVQRVVERPLRVACDTLKLYSLLTPCRCAYPRASSVLTPEQPPVASQNDTQAPVLLCRCGHSVRRTGAWRRRATVAHHCAPMPERYRISFLRRIFAVRSAAPMYVPHYTR